MPALYQSADVFMHLSKEEAFGNVFLEAMACGLPVVAGNSSRIRWIVGEEEYLFNSDDGDTIAQQIEHAQRAPQEQRERRAAKAAEFSWTKIGSMYHDFLREVVQSSKQ
jgi:glycosyltransferase involved in cell wall biosynthesis